MNAESTELANGATHAVVGAMVFDLPVRSRGESRVAPSPAGGLRVLLVEDHAADAALIERTLRDGGGEFSCVAVAGRAAFEAELERRPPDLILSDYHMPGFSGRQAFELAKAGWPNTPFIFVTGPLGEEVAVELLKEGATDYVFKSRLGRLVPSVHRALREMQMRRDHERAEEKLRASHEQLRALTNHLHSVREDERTRIARQVHDELGQALTGLKLDLAWLAGKLGGAAALRRKVQDMSAHIDATIHTVRDIATELRPGVLDSLGLVAAIEWQASDFKRRTGIACTASTDVSEALLDPNLATVCFRIFQETLTNIIRHAQATRVEVLLTRSEDFFVLTVRDNGRGVSEREINARAIGLIGMKERAAQIGGEVFFFGLPSQGTTMTLRVPLLAGAAAEVASPGRACA